MAARDRQAENPALGEVPGRVEAHRRPQPPGQHVDRAEQDAGLDRDRQAREPGGARIAEMGRAEQGRGQRQRDPAPGRLLDIAEQYAAEEQLLGEAGNQRRAGERRPDRLQPASAGHLIAAERGDESRPRSRRSAPRPRCPRAAPSPSPGARTAPSARARHSGRTARRPRSRHRMTIAALASSQGEFGWCGNCLIRTVPIADAGREDDDRDQHQGQRKGDDPARQRRRRRRRRRSYDLVGHGLLLPRADA